MGKTTLAGMTYDSEESAPLRVHLPIHRPALLPGASKEGGVIRPSTVIYDLETAGLDLRDAVIQIAGLAVGPAPEFPELATFEVKLQFDPSAASPEALEVNSYDRATWEAEAVPPAEACRRFAWWLEAYKAVELTSRGGKPYRVAQMASYNTGFDQPRLHGLFRRCDRFLPGFFRHLDVLQLALWVYESRGGAPSDFKLGTVYGHLGGEPAAAHDAAADCAMTAHVLRRLWAMREGDERELRRGAA